MTPVVAGAAGTAAAAAAAGEYNHALLGVSSAQFPDPALFRPENWLRGAARVGAPLANDVDHPFFRMFRAELRFSSLGAGAYAVAGSAAVPAVRWLLGAPRVNTFLVFHVHHANLGVLSTELRLSAALHAVRRHFRAVWVATLLAAHVHHPGLGVAGTELWLLGARRGKRRQLEATLVRAALAADVHHAILGVLGTELRLCAVDHAKVRRAFARLVVALLDPHLLSFPFFGFPRTSRFRGKITNQTHSRYTRQRSHELA